jgi:cyclic pyranopterin monophosphate synthase
MMNGDVRKEKVIKKRNKQKQGMVDISKKKVTKRIAIASSQIKMSPKAFKLLIVDGSPKGDVFETAKIAGIMAAKSTPTVIPLCHPLELSKVKISFDIDKKRYAVTTTAEVVYLGRTGVEMEALTAAAASALTIYDMMKWADKSMVISEMKLLRKSGGQSGRYTRL